MADGINGSSTVIFWVVVSLNIFLTVALGMLWATFQTLQVVIAMPLLQVKAPANLLEVFQGFSDIVNMKLIDTQKVYEVTLGRLFAAR